MFEMALVDAPTSVHPKVNFIPKPFAVTLPDMPGTPAQRPPAKAAKSTGRKAAKSAARTGPSNDLELAHLRYQNWSKVIDGARIGFWILCSFLPLTGVAEIAKNIAGKN